MIIELYKTLFEVLFLHEYFLTDADGSSIFDAANIGNAAGYLSTKMKQDRPSVNGVVQLSATPATQAVLKQQQMRMVSCYSGFKVAVRVTAGKLADGTAVYTPFTPLAGTCNFSFVVGNELGTITNSRMQRTLSGSYFFSNAPLPGAKTYPVLSNPIAARSTTYPYEQGELLNDGGTIKAYYYDGKNPQYLAVTGNGFVNESDRLLVGTSFTYRFRPTDAVSSASFALKDGSGNVLKTITSAATKPLGSVSLDFSSLPLVTAPDAGLSDPLLYTLVVTGNGGYAQTLPLIFYDGGNPGWGMVQLQVKVADAAYSLLDGNGNLPASTPAFHIRCKSPLLFRKYLNNEGATLSAPAAGLQPFLQQSGSALMTIKPGPLTLVPYFFSTNPTASSPNWVYLPAPLPDGELDATNNQLSSVIRVPGSKLFPIV
jgi:hypothetical protein